MNKNSEINAERKKTKARILKAASLCFQRDGIKAVKMDDIASMLSISKRTLYEIYSDKETLLYACVRERHKFIERRMKLLQQKGRNPMEYLIEFYRLQVDRMSQTNPKFYLEMTKYPRVTTFLENKHRENSNKSADFFKGGVLAGYFRDDINYDIVSHIGDACMQHVMQSKLYEVYPMAEIFRNILFLFIRGFCTEKGQRELDNLIVKL